MQTYAATNSGNYTCTITNLCGTVTSNTLAMILRPIPTAVISGSQTICSGSSAIITVTFTGTANWHGYYSTTGSSYTNFNTALNPFTYTVSPTVTTTYYLKISGTTAPCTDPASNAISVTITVNQPPTASAGGTQTIKLAVSTENRGQKCLYDLSTNSVRE